MISSICGAGRRQHEAGVEDALVVDPLVAEGGEERLEDRLDDLGLRRVGEEAGGGVGAHAAGVRAGVALADPLVVLREGEELKVGPVGDREEGDLGSGEAFLDHDTLACVAEDPPFHDFVDGEGGLAGVLREDDALARGEAVGLDDLRVALRLAEFLAVGVGGEGIG